jgi:hypothetical protein
MSYNPPYLLYRPICLSAYLPIEREKLSELEAEKRALEGEIGSRLGALKERQEGELKGIERKYRDKQTQEMNRYVCRMSYVVSIYTPIYILYPLYPLYPLYHIPPLSI